MPIKILLVALALILPLVPTFWAILDVPKRRFSSSRKRTIWFGVVSTLPFFGAMIYILFVRRHTQPLETPNG